LREKRPKEKISSIQTLREKRPEEETSPTRSLREKRPDEVESESENNEVTASNLPLETSVSEDETSKSENEIAEAEDYQNVLEEEVNPKELIKNLTKNPATTRSGRTVKPPSEWWMPSLNTLVDDIEYALLTTPTTYEEAVKS